MQVFTGASIFNAGMGAFLTKWMRDVRDAQTEDGRFADYAPHPFQKTLAAQGRRDFTGAPGWGDAGVLVPWQLWQMYGDRRQLEESYPSAVRWVEFIRSRNPDLVWNNARGNDYGDWLNSDAVDQPGVPKTGGSMPKPVFATIMFAHTTRVLAQMAEVLGKDADAVKYRELARAITAAFQSAFVTADGRIEGGTQAGYALALHFDLVPESLRAAAVGHLVAAIDAYRGHASTGIHATHRMMLELSRSGRSDIAYGIVNKTTLPSWGYGIAHGATTTWERWDGYVKGSGFQNAQTNSFNHFATGAVAEWMYRAILGINNDPAAPGFQRFSIRPRPGGGLTWAKGSYHSIRGTIESSWRLAGDALTIEVRVPPNTVAEVFVPAKTAERVTEGGAPATGVSGVRLLRMQDDAAVFEVQSGRYTFVAR
jgi:alpha-L-rhamnosidase